MYVSASSVLAHFPFFAICSLFGTLLVNFHRGTSPGCPRGFRATDLIAHTAYLSCGHLHCQYWMQHWTCFQSPRAMLLMCSLQHVTLAAALREKRQQSRTLQQHARESNRVHLTNQSSRSFPCNYLPISFCTCTTLIIHLCSLAAAVYADTAFLVAK